MSEVERRFLEQQENPEDVSDQRIQNNLSGNSILKSEHNCYACFGCCQYNFFELFEKSKRKICLGWQILARCASHHPNW